MQAQPVLRKSHHAGSPPLAQQVNDKALTEVNRLREDLDKAKAGTAGERCDVLEGSMASVGEALRALTQEVETLKTFKTKAVTIFAVVQFAMAAIMFAMKFTGGG